MIKKQQEKLEPKSKIITIDIHNKRCGMEAKISKIILSEFNQFRNDNELNVCSLKQSRPSDGLINVTWITQKKYNHILIDLPKIDKEFAEFAEFNSDDFCQISSVNYEDNISTVEYSIYRNYELNFAFHEEKTDE